MEQKISHGEEELYRCPVCGLHYHDKETMEKCETWCNEHQSCNLEIIEKAVEHASAQDNERDPSR